MTLAETLKELERKNIPGKILTTNYLNFSEPKALEKLHALKNIEIRMFDSEKSGEGFHTKGYIFRKDEIYRIIIGSSNMTGNALEKVAVTIFVSACCQALPNLWLMVVFLQVGFRFIMKNTYVAIPIGAANLTMLTLLQLEPTRWSSFGKMTELWVPNLPPLSKT